jgi:hypothetical protein
MDWARILAYVTGTVNQFALKCLQYLVNSCFQEHDTFASGGKPSVRAVAY